MVAEKFMGLTKSPQAMTAAADPPTKELRRGAEYLGQDWWSTWQCQILR